MLRKKRINRVGSLWTARLTLKRHSAVHTLFLLSPIIVPVPEQMLLRSLRKNQHAVRADVKRAVEGEAVALARFSDHFTAPVAFKDVAVTLPIAVEAEFPSASEWEADDVTLLGLVQEVGNDHDVVRRAALVPTVVGEELAFVAQVINPGELPAEAAAAAVAIEPKTDEIAV